MTRRTTRRPSRRSETRLRLETSVASMANQDASAIHFATTGQPWSLKRLDGNAQTSEIVTEIRHRLRSRPQIERVQFAEKMVRAFLFSTHVYPREGQRAALVRGWAAMRNGIAFEGVVQSTKRFALLPGTEPALLSEAAAQFNEAAAQFGQAGVRLTAQVLPNEPLGQ